MKCPICKAENDIFDNLKFYAIDSKLLILPYFICQCSFLYYRHAFIDDLYISNNKYISANTGSGANSEFDVKRLGQSLEIVKNRILLEPNKFCNFLDVGCNNGNFIRKLMNSFKNGRFFGTDLIIGDKVMADLNEIGVSLAKTTQIDFFGTEKMDFISVLHVLEHIDDLEEFLLGLKRAVRPDGLIYIEIPDANRYIDYFITPYSYFDLEHINHFTLTSLQKLLANYLFEIESSFEFDIDMSEDVKYPVLGVFIKNMNK
jgi:SAM-dependent methyltransferase